MDLGLRGKVAVITGGSTGIDSLTAHATAAPITAAVHNFTA